MTDPLVWSKMREIESKMVMPRWLHRWFGSPEPTQDWDEWSSLMEKLERAQRKDNIRKIRKFARIVAMEIKRL